MSQERVFMETVCNQRFNSSSSLRCRRGRCANARNQFVLVSIIHNWLLIACFCLRLLRVTQVVDHYRGVHHKIPRTQQHRERAIPRVRCGVSTLTSSQDLSHHLLLGLLAAIGGTWSHQRSPLITFHVGVVRLRAATARDVDVTPLLAVADRLERWSRQLSPSLRDVLRYGFVEERAAIRAAAIQVRRLLYSVSTATFVHGANRATPRNAQHCRTPIPRNRKGLRGHPPARSRIRPRSPSSSSADATGRDRRVGTTASQTPRERMGAVYLAGTRDSSGRWR